MKLDPQEYAVEVAGGCLPCIQFGHGPRPLVMLPGLRTDSIEGTSTVVAWYYRRFAEAFTVYMLDRKAPVAPDCTIHDLAEDTAAAIEKLGLQGVALYGVSEGGMIALDLAIHHPELVGALVLAVTASRCNDVIRETIGTWVDMVERGEPESILRDYIYRGYSAGYLKRHRLLIPLSLKLQKMKDPDRFIALAKACLTCDCYDRLDQVRCPVLVLGGGQDKVVSGEASREMAEKLGAECHIYEDLSHEAYNEAKDFNRRIYDFLMKQGRA